MIEKPEKNSKVPVRNEVVSTVQQNSYNPQDDCATQVQKRQNLKSLTREVSDTNMAEIDALREKENLIMKWRGYTYDPDESAFVDTSEPIMSDEGVMKLSQLLDSYVNKISMTTSMREESVRNELIAANKAWNALLADNKKLWKIKLTDLGSISQQLDIFVNSALSKSIGDAQRGHTTRRTRVTESKQAEPRMSM